MADLESPDSADELYRYRADDVPLARPLFQGDVFDEVAVPGVDEHAGLAIVLTHACSMRRGVELNPRLIVGRVTSSSQAIDLPWTGHFRVMPLPDLIPGQVPHNWNVAYEDLGSAPTASLDLTKRIACLDDRGILLLQQRHAHHLTRFVVETAVLHEQSAAVLIEAELLEEWTERLVTFEGRTVAESHAAAATDFEAYFAPHRAALQDASRRSAVRRDTRREIQRRGS